MKDKRGGEGRMDSGGLTKTKQNQKIGERDCIDKALTLVNYFKPLMNLWRVSMSAFRTELKPQRSACQGS